MNIDVQMDRATIGKSVLMRPKHVSRSDWLNANSSRVQLRIDINPNNVIIEGTYIIRPDYINVSRWITCWEDLCHAKGWISWKTIARAFA